MNVPFLDLNKLNLRHKTEILNKINSIIENGYFIRGNENKLFEEDSYLKEYKTKIIDINENEKVIELEKTAFYAKSWGQPGDIGKIIIGNKSTEVLDTIKRDNKILAPIIKFNNLLSVELYPIT